MMVMMMMLMTMMKVMKFLLLSASCHDKKIGLGYVSDCEAVQHFDLGFEIFQQSAFQMAVTLNLYSKGAFRVFAVKGIFLEKSTAQS